VIEKISGEPYEKFVKDKVLTPIGIKTMRIGATLDGRQAPGEVRYYMAGDEKGNSLFTGTEGKVPVPYGAFNLEAMDSHGAWIASAVDLARFASALHDPSRCPVLKPVTIGAMYAPPQPPVGRREDGSLKETYYGCGWNVGSTRRPGVATYWHGGSLPGTSTWFVRRWDGVTWAMLFNQRSGGKKDGAIDGALHRAADAVTEWPKEDLFGKFG
jgi:N-acyl-D-amino-acid deacylase